MCLMSAYRCRLHDPGLQPIHVHQRVEVTCALLQMLHGQLGGITDWNSALKLGFDAAAEQYHPWLISQVRLLAWMRLDAMHHGNAHMRTKSCMLYHVGPMPTSPSPELRHAKVLFSTTLAALIRLCCIGEDLAPSSRLASTSIEDRHCLRRSRCINMPAGC